MSTVIAYCRVSSKLCTSLSTQEKIIRKYLKSCDLSISRIYYEQCSAYKKIPVKLSTLTNIKNSKLIFASVDRLSRNVNIGTRLVDDWLTNNNEIHFIREGIILNELHMQQLDDFKHHLELAEIESNIKSERIRFAKTFLNV